MRPCGPSAAHHQHLSSVPSHKYWCVTLAPQGPGVKAPQGPRGKGPKAPVPPYCWLASQQY